MADATTLPAARGGGGAANAAAAGYSSKSMADSMKLAGRQAELLQALTAVVEDTPSMFEEAARNRAAHQKHLEMRLEETLRQIKLSRAHVMQKSRHVKDIVTSCGTKFVHETQYVQNLMRHEAQEMLEALASRIAAMEEQMSNAEALLQEQRERRKGHVEEVLGPIVNGAASLMAALEAERLARRFQLEEREKMLADEIEAVRNLIDKEKTDREQQVMEFTKWAEGEESRTSKRQCQIDQNTRTRVQELREEHWASVKERVQNQDQIADSIASFIKRYREQTAEGE